MVGHDYGGGLHSDHAHGPPQPSPASEGAQTQPVDHDRPKMTPSPSYQNGSFGPPKQASGSPTLSALSTHSDPRKSGERTRSRNRSGRSTSGHNRTCKKCGDPLTGQFVRALDGTFHLDCFRCRDCGDIVASKFFPADDETNGGQYPLCETDYFRRLDLLCHQCGGALRGSYITALDRKYHVNHFTCSMCETVFAAQDSYYEHDSKVYCHFHYSTKFAQRCNGCDTAILKQFVEIFRNSQNQHWHPECYMIHKFWNVRLTPAVNVEGDLGDFESVEPEARSLIKEQEEKMEEKVYRVWSTLSTFEESSAACISDMLLHVSNGHYRDGVEVAKRFIVHVEILFISADKLDAAMKVFDDKGGLTYSRESKLLCKKIVAFFSLISKTQDTGVRKLGVTQELLSLVTGLAHYLKLLIRICLQGALRLERENHTSDPLYQLLDALIGIEKQSDATALQITSAIDDRLSANDSDQCILCRKPIEDECVSAGDKEQRWHPFCVTCRRCGRELGKNVAEARLQTDAQIYCKGCDSKSGPAGQDTQRGQAVMRISRLQQYVFLLKVALARLLAILQSSGALVHASNTYTVNGSKAGGSHVATNEDASASAADTHPDGKDHQPRESSYESTLNDVRRLRSTRLDKHLSSSLKKARTSRIMDGPEGRSVRPGSAGADHGGTGKSAMHIEEDREIGGDGTTEQYFGHSDALRLDDIPRIVAAEQAREKQPGTYGRSSRPDGLYRSPTTHTPRPNRGTGPSPSSGHQRAQSDGDADPRVVAGEAAQRSGRRYFSELSGLEYFIVRHVAVLTMQPLLGPDFTLEELLGLIEARKAPTFWNKFGKAFGNKDTRKNIKKKGVFGVPLEVVIERDGADSTDGVGPGALRIPAIIEDTITALKNKDLSVEGVFRKNGNIKKLSEQVAAVDRDGCDAIKWNDESPHQLAALLKRYLRELPDPLMTQKLYRLWVAATKIEDDDKRRYCLHLTCCLLPQIHRDSLEVLFNFLKWVATFHQVDEDTGSRMDVHNLARVMAPNILYTSAKNPSFSDEPMVAVACVEELIRHNNAMCMVPDELMEILNDSSLFSANGDITTKEILKRISERSVNGGTRQYDTELVNRQDNKRPMATRVETDPGAWHQASSVRPVHDAATGSASNQQVTPAHAQQKWRAPDNPSGQSPFVGQYTEKQYTEKPYTEKQSADGAENGQRREWRNSGSGWGRQNSSVATGTG